MRFILRTGRALALAGASSLLAAGMSLAEVSVIYETGGRNLFSVQAPDDWIVTTGGFVNQFDRESEARRDVPRVLGIAPEVDPRVWVGLFSPDGVATFDDAVAYIQSLDKTLVDDPVVATTTDRKIAGRKARNYTGSGTRDGRHVDFTLVLVDMPGNRVVIGVVLDENGARAPYVDQLNSIFQSFKLAN